MFAFNRWIKKKIKEALRIPHQSCDPVTIYPPDKPRGRVLMSYLEQPLLWPETDPRFGGHSNNWESREIARIFLRMGYIVDCIGWSNNLFYPTHQYDVLFDIDSNLQRLAAFAPPHARKILHITGSYPWFQRTAELSRVAQLEARTGKLYSPRRLSPYPDLFDRSLRLADRCSLIGNEKSLQTFPREHQDKISLVNVSASLLPWTKQRGEYVPKEREFVWFYGGGLVNKGLDLTIEAFQRCPDLVLNIVGKLETERDFLAIYGETISRSANIKAHGYLYPGSQKFIDVARRSFCFVAPSCSEGISPAAVTCLQMGLYPLLSRNNGITLPTGSGKYLEDCSIEEIEKSIRIIHTLPSATLEEEIAACQHYALIEFSRERFRKSMTTFLQEAVHP